MTATKEDQYTPLPQDPESSSYSNDEVIHESQKLQSQGRKRKLSPLTAVLLAIIFTQTLFLLHLAAKLHSTTKSLLSLNGLDFTRSTRRTAFLYSPYTSPNTTLSSAAWSSIRTGHGVVALSQDYIASHSLPPSLTHPGDESKSIYVVEAYHALHCVKMLRIHYLSLFKEDKYPPPWNWSHPHDLHCFNALRQYIMCNPDDTLLASTGNRDAGHGQDKVCGDWDALRKWAGERERRAGYRDGWDMVPREEFGWGDIWGEVGDSGERDGEGDGLVWD